MKKNHFLFFCALFFISSQASSNCTNTGPNLILLTMDGVRHQEFFKGTDAYHFFKLKNSERGEVFKIFWKKHAKQGIVLGKDKNFKLISQNAISLPSYQSLFLGQTANCRNNTCPAVSSETFLDKIYKDLNLTPKDMAVFASWEGLRYAVSSNVDSFFNAIYPNVRTDSFLNQQIVHAQQAAMQDLPKWSGSRKDQYTFQAALSYLKSHCPRVLYISLVDSDEYGHANNYSQYIASLKSYDRYIDTLINTLKNMGEYGANTHFLFTTDHSRGQGVNWTSHGKTDESNKEIFLYLRGPKVSADGVIKTDKNQSFTRKVVEYLMNVSLLNPLEDYLK
jgi:hypothetical protein